MKRVIVIEIVLAFAFAVLLACSIKFFMYVSKMYSGISMLYDLNMSDTSRNEIIERYRENIATALSYGIPALIAALATLAAMVLIALKDFPVFKPLLEKHAAKRTARKQANEVAKAEKAAADKQERIERLQSELDALKKDE